MPKVSVIIPVYNVEKYLRQCMDSVIGQTLKDIEIICVNDGSTDNSGKILDEYAKKDKRIKVIHQDNKGLGAARNVGINLATSTYLYFVDSDDWIDKTCLEKLYQRIFECDADLCIYGMHRYDEQNGIVSDNNYFSCYGKNIGNICTYKDLTSSLFENFGAPMKLYKTSWFKENNLYFTEGVHFEDVITHVKCMILANKICFFNECLYFYRFNRQDSIMNQNKTVIHTQDIYSFIMGTYDFLKEKHVYDELEYEFAKFIIEQLTFHCTRVGDMKIKKDFACKGQAFINCNFPDILDKYADIKKASERLFFRKIIFTYKLLGFIPLLKIEEK